MFVSFSFPDDLLHIFAEYMRPAVDFKVYRQLSSGDQINDVVLNLDLDSDQLVTGTAYIRPQIWQDIKNLFKNTDFQAKFDQEFAPIKRALKQELMAKQAAWERVSEGPQAAVKSVRADLKQVYNKLSRAFLKAYKANEFHMKDICDAMSDAYEKVKSQFIVLNEKVKRTMTPIYKNMQQKLQELNVQVKSCLKKNQQTIQQTFQDVKQRAAALHAEYKPQIEQAFNKVRATYKQTKDRLMEAYRTVREHPKVVEMEETLKKLQPSDIFAPIKKLKYRMSIKFQKWKEEHQEIFDAIEQVWQNVAQRQEIRDIAMFFEAAVEKVGPLQTNNNLITEQLITTQALLTSFLSTLFRSRSL